MVEELPVDHVSINPPFLYSACSKKTLKAQEKLRYIRKSCGILEGKKKNDVDDS